MDKYLIINADDFGMCRAHNAATADLFKKGGITSATVMAPCPYARDAVEFAAKNPELSVGVHLTTTSEWNSYRFGPVSENAESLKDPEGCFYKSCLDFVKNAECEEVKSELLAQIEYLRAMGLSPSHLDNHMGSLYGIVNGDFRLLKIAFEIAGEYRLPFRFPSKILENSFLNKTLDIKIPKETVLSHIKEFLDLAKCRGVATPDYLIPGDWNGEQDKSFENYREYIFELYRSFDNGVTETYIHPAVECDEIKSITPLWHRRVFEYRLFSDPKTKEFIKSLGIKLINYRELAKIKGM